MFTPLVVKGSGPGAAEEVADYREEDTYQKSQESQRADYRAGAYREGEKSKYANSFTGKMADRIGVSADKAGYSKEDFIRILKGDFTPAKGFEPEGFEEFDWEAERRLYKKNEKGEMVLNKKGQKVEKKDRQARMGLELNFSNCKSLSVAALRFGEKNGLDPEKLIDAHIEGTRKAQAYIEKHLLFFRITEKEMLQLKKEGHEFKNLRLVDPKAKVYLAQADNMLVTECLHSTSRLNKDQTEGNEPFIHSHNIMASHTFMYGKLRAIDYDIIQAHDSRVLVDNIYKTANRIAAEREGFVFENTLTGKVEGYELAGFNRPDVEKLSAGSRRITNFINEQNEARKDPSHPEFGKLVLDRDNDAHRTFANSVTRGSKDFALENAKGETVDDERDGARLSLSAAKTWWDHCAAEQGLDMSELEARFNDAQNELTIEHEKRTAQQAVDLAIDHLTERKSYIDSIKELTASALAFGFFQNSVDEIEAVIEQKINEKEIVRKPGGNGKQITTKELLDVERESMEIFKAGMNSCEPIASKELYVEHLARYQLEKGFNLSKSQAKAVEVALLSKSSTIINIGRAGVGKSTAAELIKNVSQATGRKVFGMGTTGKAVEALKESIENTVTSQSAAMSEKWWQENVTEGSVIVLDEDGLKGSRLQLKIQKYAQQYNARLILVGDYDQYQSVEAGSPLKMLSEIAVKESNSDNFVIIDEMQRARKHKKTHELHEESFANPAKAILTLQRDGLLFVGKDDECFKQIAKDYAKLEQSQRYNTFVITSTNADRSLLNAAIRKELGLDIKPGIEFNSLERFGLTNPQLKNASSYEPGMVVFMNSTSQHTGLQKGEALKVIEILGKKVRLERTIENRVGGTRKEIVDFYPERDSGSISLGITERISFSEGDAVRFTAESKKMGVINGDRGFVQGVNLIERTVDIKLNSGKLINIRLEENGPGVNVRSGFAATGHSSQAGTASNRGQVFKYIPIRNPANYNEFYTDATRSTIDQMRIYTNGIGGSEARRILRAANQRVEFDRAHETPVQEKIEDVSFAFAGKNGWDNRVDALPANEVSLLKQIQDAREKIGPEMSLLGNDKWNKEVVRVIVENDLDITIQNEKMKEFQVNLIEEKRSNIQSSQDMENNLQAGKEYFQSAEYQAERDLWVQQMAEKYPDTTHEQWEQVYPENSVLEDSNEAEFTLDQIPEMELDAAEYDLELMAITENDFIQEQAREVKIVAEVDPVKVDFERVREITPERTLESVAPEVTSEELVSEARDLDSIQESAPTTEPESEKASIPGREIEPVAEKDHGHQAEAPDVTETEEPEPAAIPKPTPEPVRHYPRPSPYDDYERDR